MIVLDRMEIEEVGFNPERLAQAVHNQLGPLSGPVPVREIAAALDIVQIRDEPLNNFEGALLMPPDRNRGSILVNNQVHPRRQRFTIAHELGHYLNLGHDPQSSGSFECSRNDMRIWGEPASQDKHQRQELEANRFAIALLAPQPRFVPSLRTAPDLSHVVSLANTLDLSKEAVARRYIDLNDHSVAIAFSTNSLCRYVIRSTSCPALCLRNQTNMPDLPLRDDLQNPTPLDEADPSDWLYRTDNKAVFIQTLWQHDGYCMTLVLVEETEDSDEDDGIEDTFERFDRFR
ncbi:MAG: ImmA/IrrE family metallo-endopeptidase [Pseudomonadota bacterium]